MFGATGTIGRAVAHALAEAGFEPVCVVRSGAENCPELAGYICQTADVSSVDSVRENAFSGDPFHAVISCLASRSGTPRDARAIDYQANSNILSAAKSAGVPQMILLSAICVQKPRLAFQRAKLAFERELIDPGLTWSVVRPTAFFKSLSGQVERVRQGKPFLLFGNGEITRCKPISDTDLARYIVSCIDDPQCHNRILPIGGPGPAITPLEQGAKLFELTGQPPRYRRVPPALLDVIIAALGVVGRFSQSVADKAEYARIGRYYATESMLVWDETAGRYDEAATPEAGSETLFDHYTQLVEESPER
ncbi:NAD(P)H-binding protein [Altererythrobacter sp. BO-6]|nr:NAD(P)H-binding protein [Altererythrobacter sp. BO-6]